MTKKRRRFSPEERLSLVKEAEREGFMETCPRHNLAPTMLNRWKKKHLEQGTEGLKPVDRRVDPELRALEEENERMKKIIANQALELEVKSELLRNSIPPG